MSVSKTEIIARVAAASGASSRDVRSIVGALLDEITVSLTAGDSVSLGSFGSFALEQPVGSQQLRVKAAKVPKFKAGKALRDAIR